jgi:hypothetical protein
MRAREFITESAAESEITYKTRPSPHYRKQQPDYVMGDEVENTPAYGKKSLFITSVADYDLIEQMAKDHNIKQLYFEFIWAIDNHPNAIPKVIKDFRKALKYFLDKGYLCGLDTPAEYAEKFADLHKYKNLINNIAIDIPKLDKYNDNTVVKLRDAKFGGDNGGVYVTPLNKIMTDKNFTSWGDFGPDVEIVPERQKKKP